MDGAGAMTTAYPVYPGIPTETVSSLICVRGSMACTSTEEICGGMVKYPVTLFVARIVTSAGTCALGMIGTAGVGMSL